MNTSRPDRNDRMIDIYIVSAGDTVVSLLTEHLEKKGYRTASFTDSKKLFEAIGAGKPNLLICDTTAFDQQAIEICRRIKADNDLSVIPVLILTRASTLSDLFDVLDCDADNFLPLPLDIPYCLSVIESMVRTPVERQTTEQIKTQFRIRHDDRIYTVAASRRKLLDLLLSSFEIAINTSSELFHVKTDFQTLTESARYLEARVTEQARLIDTIQTVLHQKEQKILSLTSDVEEKQKLLAQKTRKAFIVSDDGTGENLSEEKNVIERLSPSEHIMLIQQISILSDEVEATKKSLDSVRQELEDGKIHCTSLECTIELLNQQKELAEKSLRSISEEHKQLISAFESEREKVVSAEQEVKAIMQAKTQSEQELTQIINDLADIKKHQAADLDRLKSELETELNRKNTDEKQADLLFREKEHWESLLQSTENSLKDQLDDLHLQVEVTRAALENEKNSTKLLKEKLAETAAWHEKTELQLQEDLESEKAIILRLNHDREEATALQNTLQNDMNALTIQNKAVRDEMDLANQGRIQSDQRVRELEDELNTVLTSLDTERRLREAGDQNIEALRMTIQGLEQDFQSQVEEQNSQKEFLDHERKLRISAENKYTTACQEHERLAQELQVLQEENFHLENDRIIRIQNLEEELELESNLKHSTEKQDTLPANEKIRAEPAGKESSDELQPIKNVIVETGLDPLKQDGSFVSVSEESRVWKPSFRILETPIIQKENVQDRTLKEVCLPVIPESPPQAFSDEMIHGTQKGKGSEKKPTSSSHPSKNPEIIPRAVTDIIDTFSDDDLFEEN